MVGLTEVVKLLGNDRTFNLFGAQKNGCSNEVFVRRGSKVAGSRAICRRVISLDKKLCSTKLNLFTSVRRCVNRYLVHAPGGNPLIT